LPFKLRSWLREPLLHFLLIGAGLFLYFALHGEGSGSSSNRIVVNAAQVQHLAASFARTWQRPPTSGELKSLVDDYVREEIAVREAMKMGLDRDDTVMRRRLRQKLEFIAQDAIDAAPVGEEALRAWYTGHADEYAIEPAIAFTQIYIDRDRRGVTADAEALKLLGRLQAGALDDPTDLGDATMLPGVLPLAAKSEVARTFGSRFADAVFDVAPGRWSGPIESTFGLHLVLVNRLEPAREPDFDDIRRSVERDYLAERRRRELEAMYERLLADYTVVVDARAAQDEVSDESSSQSTGAVVR